MQCKITKYLDVKQSSLDEKRRGKSALITGASSGLGRELAVLFSGIGHVILSGRNLSGLSHTTSLCSDPANTTVVCGDLRESETRERLVSITDLYGIRYLVCAAGQYVRDVISPQEMTDVFESNATAPISLIAQMRPVLARVGGSIIHINSMAGKNLSPGEEVYSASKHAMKGFLQAFRFEAREKGVRVLDVFAGAMQTPMLADRPGYDKMMNVKEVARAIFTVATLDLPTAQIEELHLGRIRV